MLKDVNYNELSKEEIRDLIVQQLLLEWNGGEGTITTDTASEVYNFAIRSLGVGGMDGGGWDAAKAALKIASQQQEE